MAMSDIVERLRTEIARLRTHSREERERHGWQVERGVTCVVCPDCAFTFDADHEDDRPEGGYTCPNCSPEEPVEGFADVVRRVLTKRAAPWTAPPYTDEEAKRIGIRLESNPEIRARLHTPVGVDRARLTRIVQELRSDEVLGMTWTVERLARAIETHALGPIGQPIKPSP